MAEPDPIEIAGRAAFLSGVPCEAPEYGKEMLRARWRLGWKKEQAARGVKPAIEAWGAFRPDGTLAIHLIGWDLWSAWGRVQAVTDDGLDDLQKAGWTVRKIKIQEAANG
jgi:hypothetical protein